LTGPATFSMCTSPKDLSVQGDAAFDLGESQVVAVAVGRQVARRPGEQKSLLAVGEVHFHRARNCAQMRVPMRGAVTLRPAPSPAAVTSPLPAFTCHLAPFLGTVTVRLTRPLLLLSDLISTALPLTVSCGSFGVEDLLGIPVRAGVGHLMRLHLDIRPVARGHAHVAARILDIDRRVGGNLRSSAPADRYRARACQRC
jgi:hypothetical protein